jgi:hypothetical protein
MSEPEGLRELDASEMGRWRGGRGVDGDESEVGMMRSNGADASAWSGMIEVVPLGRVA